MSDLQILVNEDITDYFSTEVPNIAEPISWSDITKHQLIDSSTKGTAKVSTEINAKIFNIEAAEAFHIEYQCITTLVDTGQVWKVSHTSCQATEEI